MQCCFFCGGMQHSCQCNNHANKRYLAKTMPESIWHSNCMKSRLMQQICQDFMAQFQLMQRICQVISSLLSLIYQNIPHIGHLSFSPNHQNMLNDD